MAGQAVSFVAYAQVISVEGLAVATVAFGDSYGAVSTALPRRDAPAFHLSAVSNVIAAVVIAATRMPAR